jgi:type 1 fimbria pilin
MKSKYLLAITGLATFFAAQSISAQDAYGRMTFIGNVVQSACSSNLPPVGMQGGMGSCSLGSALQAVYAEQVAPPRWDTGIAMLDYFADRPDGGQKYVATRQYR